MRYWIQDVFDETTELAEICKQPINNDWEKKTWKYSIIDRIKNIGTRRVWFIVKSDLKRLFI